MFVLDTNIISELRSGKPSQSAAVRRWAAEVPANRLYLTAVAVLELEMGVLAMERKDALQGGNLRSWLQGIMGAFSSRILAFTGETALLCAALHIPNRRSYRDSMIAATAKEHGYALVTRNTSDFIGCGVQLVDPWLTPDLP